MKIKELFIQYKQIILYLFFGGCTTLVNIIAYYLCTRAGCGTAAGTVIAWILSVLFAYLTNRKFVFESRAAGFTDVMREAAAFVSCRLATGIMDLAIMLVFVDLLHLNDIVVKIVSNILVIVLNYVASKLFIFKKGSEQVKSNRVYSFLNGVSGFFRILFCIYIFVTLLMVIFIDNNISRHYIPKMLQTSNIVLIGFSLLLFGLFVYSIWLFSRRRKKIIKSRLSNRQFYILIAFCFVGVYALQLFISTHMYFKSGWDVGVMRDCAEAIVYDNADGVDSIYFSVYPNNMMLVYTLVFFYKLGNKLYSTDPYMVVVAAVNFIVCLSVFLSTVCVYRITKNRPTAVISMLVGIVLVALSPWIVIPYSDAIGMFFPIIAITCYIFVSNKYVKYGLMFFFCVIGYYYKPTIIILLIALVMLKICAVIVKIIRKENFVRQGICCILSMVVAVGCAIGVQHGVYSLNKTELNEQAQMTITHYFMMGLNPECEGVFSQKDVDYSWSFPDKESRQSANIQVAKERLKQMGLAGYIKLLVKKNLNNYNDGTFSWSREGSFYEEIPESTGSTTDILRSFYYTNGENFVVFNTIEHVVWLTVLISICFCVFKRKRGADAESLIALTLLGVSLFLLLFECRARYLYIFSPLYLILAGAGLYKASKVLERVKNFLKKG